MNQSYYDQVRNFATNNQSIVAGTILFVVAFSIFTMNATFNQAGVHPVPLFSNSEAVITNSIRVPVRRVETSSYSSSYLGDKIPVPQLSPLTRLIQKVAQPAPVPEIKISRTGVDAKMVQHLLSQLNFYTGPVDGIIGSGTKSAIRDFERSKLLPESGDVSQSLILLLENAIDVRLRQITTASQETSNVEVQTIGNGAMITRIQVGLINFGIPDIGIDGLMGTKTKQAIEKFQHQFKLEVNGMPSAALVKKLEDVGALTRG